MVVYLTDEAHRQAEDQIQEQLDENLPEDVDERDRNWQALAQWANRHFGINTNDRELKKLGVEGAEDGELDRGALYSYLNSRAQEAIARVDFTDLGTILEENFNRRTLCGWLKHQYNLDLDPEEIAGFEDLNRTKLWVGEKLRQQYREQEIKFPVAVGLLVVGEVSLGEGDCCSGALTVKVVVPEMGWESALTTRKVIR